MDILAPLTVGFLYTREIYVRYCNISVLV